MNHVSRVFAFAMVAFGATATPAWSKAGVLRSGSPPLPRCDSALVKSSTITVHPVVEGIWKGFTVFGMMCGPIKGELLFGSRDSLRFTLSRHGEASNAPLVPLIIRREFLQRLLRDFFSVAGRRPAYSFATNSFPEIGARLAAASAESPTWDRQSGRPRNIDISLFTQRLMNHEETYPELRKVFREFGYDIRVSGVEDVVVLTVAQMTGADRAFIAVPLRPADKLPVSAATYFRVCRRGK